MVVPENQEFAVENSASLLEPQSRLLFPDRDSLDRQTLSILQQATQASAEFLEIPLCILGGVQNDRRLRQLAVSFVETDLEDIEEFQNFGKQLPQISADRAFWQEVLDSQTVVAIRDLVKDRKWARSIWVQQYGIRAFLGVPLLTSSNDRPVGVLMAMDLAPRRFSSKDIQFLELTARWTIAELERIEASPIALGRSLSNLSSASVSTPPKLQDRASDDRSSLLVMEQLISSMTEEMRTPLTSVTGMARVLNQEVYGHLNEKQKEYLNIIYDSGRYLVSLLDELVALRRLHNQTPGLAIGSVDIEMLCQQVFNDLELETSQQGQKFRLSLEPGDRLVLLDKSKVYQILYHLLARVIKTSHAGGVVRLHVSRTTHFLKMIVWVSHPFVAESLNSMDMLDMESDDLLNELTDEQGSWEPKNAIEGLLSGQINSSAVEAIEHLISAFKNSEDSESSTGNSDEKSSMKLSRQDLGILLSWELTRQHKGKIALERSSHSGDRYLLEFPLNSEVPAT